MLIEFVYGAVAQLQRFAGRIPVALGWSGPAGAGAVVTPEMTFLVPAVVTSFASPAVVTSFAIPDPGPN